MVGLAWLNQKAQKRNVAPAATSRTIVLLLATFGLKLKRWGANRSRNAIPIHKIPTAALSHIAVCVHIAVLLFIASLPSGFQSFATFTALFVGIAVANREHIEQKEGDSNKNLSSCLAPY